MKIDLAMRTDRFQPPLHFSLPGLLFDVDSQTIGRDMLVDLNPERLSIARPACARENEEHALALFSILREPGHDFGGEGWPALLRLLDNTPADELMVPLPRP